MSRKTLKPAGNTEHKMNKKSNTKILISTLFLITAFGLSIIFRQLDANQADSSVLNAEGRQLFFKQITKELLRHPRTFSLEVEDIRMILAADTKLEALYNAVTRLLYLERGEDFPARPDSAHTIPSPEFRTAWLELCRDGADRFVRSLFLREPLTAETEQTVLEQVAADLGIRFPGKAAKIKSPGHTKSQYQAVLARALSSVNAPEANAISTGEGVNIAVIGPNRLETRDSESTNVPPWTASPPVGSERLDSGDAKAAAAAAPGAEVRFWPLVGNQESTYRYWSAVQTSIAIRYAMRADTRILVIANSFAIDYPCLRKACLEAYRNNSVIISGIGRTTAVNPEKPQSFPAHYRTTLAVAGVFMARNDRLSPKPGYSASHFTDLAAPASTDMTIVPETAAGLCGAAAALIADKMPPVPEDLPGQYFQRIREVLVRSADKQILRQKHFDPAMGYGLLDIEKAAGKELKEYLIRRKQIEEDFKRRLEARKKDQEKADKARKEAENKKK